MFYNWKRQCEKFPYYGSLILIGHELIEKKSRKETEF